MTRIAALALAIIPFLFTTPVLADPPQLIPVQRELVVSGLTRPLFVTHAPNDYNRIFIVEQPGRIRVYNFHTQQLSTFLDITTSVRDNANEQGLLGLAFHPDYENNGHFFVCYTAPVGVGDTRIARFSVDPNNSNAALPASQVVLLQFSQPFNNHNGGWIGFSPTDGANYLYFSSGDGGSGNDPNGYGQNIIVLWGKMLRIDVDNSTAGNPAPAPGNPFIGITGNDLIWHYGLRNAWRCSFDRETGDLIMADVGQGAREEVSVQLANPAGTGPADFGYQGGQNYGWRCMEGFNCTGLSGCTCNAPALTLPIHDYARVGGGGPCSITGGYVYRGCVMPEMRGTYFFGDYCSGDVWSAVLDIENNTISNLTNRKAELTPPNFNLSSFGEDAFGELYMTFLGQGSVWKIVPGPGYDITDCDNDGIADACAVAAGLVPDTNNNGIPDSCECIGDINDDNLVNLDDFIILAGNFGSGPGAAPQQGDLNGDGFVNLDDFIVLAGNFGNDCN